MNYDFDRLIERRDTDSEKWNYYEDDVLPLWVADMDFRSAEPVIRALEERAAHGIFGYAIEPPALRECIVEHLAETYGWQVAPDALVFLPGVVTGFNLAIRTVTTPGDGVLVQTPVYFPFLSAPGNAICTLDAMELTRLDDGSYGVDWDAFEAAITPRTRVFLLCNPHNPVGRVFCRDELERMAEVCLRHDLAICADEIHCDLLFDGQRHIPMATLGSEVARRTITLMGPSKAYNVAGLHGSFAIVEDHDLRCSFQAAGAGLVARHLSVMAHAAMLACYRDGGPWLEALLAYLQANRDYLAGYVTERLPGVSMWKPEGTYLAWLDCRAAGLPVTPHRFFLEEARVGMNDGATFGPGGEGFVRLNFGCPRPVLEEALERMRAALEQTAPHAR